MSYELWVMNSVLACTWAEFCNSELWIMGYEFSFNLFVFF